MKKISRLDAHYIALFCSIFLGTSCLGAYLSAYLLDLGFTNTFIGTTLACGSILGIILQPVMASVADKLQNMSLRTLLSILYCITCSLVFIIWMVPKLFPNHAIVPTAVLFVILNSISGVEGSLVNSLGMEHNYGGKGINFSLARGCGSFAYAVSSLTVGFIVGDVGTKFLVPAHLAVRIITLIIVSTFPRPGHEAAEAATAAGKTEEHAASILQFVKNNKRFMLVVLAIVLVYTHTAILNNFSVQLIDFVGGEESQVGVSIFIAAFLELPAMAMFPVILRKVGSVSKIVIFASIMMTIKAFIAGFAPSVEWIYIAQLFQCGSFALLFPAGVYYVNRFVPRKDKVKGQSFMNMALTVSSVTVSLFGGKIIDTVGIGILSKIAAGLVAAGTVTLMFIIHKDKTPAEKKKA